MDIWCRKCPEARYGGHQPPGGRRPLACTPLNTAARAELQGVGASNVGAAVSAPGLAPPHAAVMQLLSPGPPAPSAAARRSTPALHLQHHLPPAQPAPQAASGAHMGWYRSCAANVSPPHLAQPAAAVMELLNQGPPAPPAAALQPFPGTAAIGQSSTHLLQEKAVPPAAFLRLLSSSAPTLHQPTHLVLEEPATRAASGVQTTPVAPRTRLSPVPRAPKDSSTTSSSSSSSTGTSSSSSGISTSSGSSGTSSGEQPSSGAKRDLFPQVGSTGPLHPPHAAAVGAPETLVGRGVPPIPPHAAGAGPMKEELGRSVPPMPSHAAAAGLLERRVGSAVPRSPPATTATGPSEAHPKHSALPTLPSWVRPASPTETLWVRPSLPPKPPCVRAASPAQASPSGTSSSPPPWRRHARGPPAPAEPGVPRQGCNLPPPPTKLCAYHSYSPGSCHFRSRCVCTCLISLLTRSHRLSPQACKYIPKHSLVQIQGPICPSPSPK